MKNSTLSRIGAGCGAVFPIVLFVAAGNGHGFSGPRAVSGLVAITLAIPFIAYLCAMLRTAAGRDAWLPGAAMAAGVTGIALKLVSTFPELANHRAHLADGTVVHKALQQIADGATLISLFPLAVFCGATAIVVLRTRVLPRWVGAGAALTAVALAVNGADLRASFVPALLLFLAWTLATSVYLLRRTWRQPAPVATPAAA